MLIHQSIPSFSTRSQRISEGSQPITAMVWGRRSYQPSGAGRAWRSTQRRISVSPLTGKTAFARASFVGAVSFLTSVT